MKKALVVILIAAGIGIGASALLFRQRDTGRASGLVAPAVTEITSVPAASGSGGKEESPMQSPTSTATQTPSPKPKIYSAPPPMTIDANKTYMATLTTSKGVMNVTLLAKDTPIAVNNFVFLAREGFYNTTTFHRIMKGFMIQGGDPRSDGTGGPGYRFNDEPMTRNYTRGTLAMANSGPNTNGSQFFIMHADYALPKNYVIFGAIDPADAKSLATLDAIAQTPVTTSAGGEQSKPLDPITVTSVTIQEN